MHGSLTFPTRRCASRLLGSAARWRVQKAELPMGCRSASISSSRDKIMNKMWLLPLALAGLILGPALPVSAAPPPPRGLRSARGPGTEFVGSTDAIGEQV